MDEKLLARAAHCYERAGWLDDASRCYTALDDHTAVARLHEAAQRWEAAAGAHGRADAWRDAARCYLRAERPGDAAESLLAAGETLEGCWLLASRLQAFGRAQAAAEALAPGSPEQALARQLVIARCRAARGAKADAAAQVRTAAEALQGLAPGRGRQRVANWALDVADALERPDLAALIHAAAHRAALPHAAARWEGWAVDTLGEAAGIPLPSAAAEHENGDREAEREQ